MTDPHPGDRSREPDDRAKSEASVHPERAVDAIEEKVFGHQMNQDRHEKEDEGEARGDDGAPVPRPAD